MGGDCKSTCIIYAASCIKCNNNNVYIGKTLQRLNQRVNGHRSRYYALSRGERNLVGAPSLVGVEVDDTNILGAHLVINHGCRLRSDFNESYRFDVIRRCNPNELRKNEQFYIDKLRTLRPFGLNQMESIS